MIRDAAPRLDDALPVGRERRAEQIGAARLQMSDIKQPRQHPRHQPAQDAKIASIQHGWKGFNQIRERLPFPAIEPTGDGQEQQPQHRDVDHERELISRPRKMARNPADPEMGHCGLQRSPAKDVASLKRRNARKAAEIAIAMNDRQAMAHRTRRDETVDTGAHSDSCPATSPIQIDRLVEHHSLQGRFHNGQCMQRLPRDMKRMFVTKPLEDFLNHRQTGDHLFQIRDRFQLKRGAPSEHFYPDRRVNEKHVESPAAAGGLADPGAFLTGLLPTAQNRQARESDAL
jgi:hypothetical protein